MDKKEKSKMEKAFLECLENYRILYFSDLLRQEGFDGDQPLLEKKKPVPTFDKADYLKRYGEDFSVYFANESVQIEFIEKQYAHDVAEVEESNRKIDARNENRMAEWREKLSRKSFGEMNDVEQRFRQYTNKEPEGVIWFFLKVIRNIPHDFFYHSDFHCAYDQQTHDLKLHFAFPDKLSVFVSQDDDRPINSIQAPSFKRYYYGILILIIRNLLNALYKNDLENALENVYLEGVYSDKEDSRADSASNEPLSIHFHMDIDSLKKILLLQPEDLFKEVPSTFEVPPDDVPVVPEDSDAEGEEERTASEPVMVPDESDDPYDAFEEKLLKGLKILSDIKDRILHEDDHSVDFKSFEYPEKREQNADGTVQKKDSEKVVLSSSGSKASDSEKSDAVALFQTVDELSEPLMSVFLKMLRMDPTKTHPLDSLNTSKLNILNLVNKLVFQGRTLIRLSGYEWDEFSWGEEFPNDIIEQLRKRYLQTGVFSTKKGD